MMNPMHDYNEQDAAESAERAFDAEERRFARERHDDGAEREAERDEELEREDQASMDTLHPVLAAACAGWLRARRVARELRGV